MTQDIGTNATVFDEQGRVLLVHQTYRGRKWVWPGGAVVPGEAPWDAAVREAREETGLVIEPVRLASLYYFADREALGFGFASRVIGGRLVVDGAEISEAGFFDPAGLPLPMTRAGRQRLADILAQRDETYLRTFGELEVIHSSAGDVFVEELPVRHHRNAKQVVALAMVFDPEGRILFVPAPVNGQPCGLPAGSAADGEAPWDAAVRTVQEQAGLQVVIERLAGVDFRRERNALTLQFSCRAFGGAPVSAAQFCDPADLPPALGDDDARVIRNALSRSARPCLNTC